MTPRQQNPGFEAKPLFPLGFGPTSTLCVMCDTAKRDAHAAYRFLRKACIQNGKPRVVTIDGSAANLAGIEGFNKKHRTRIDVRQKKYLNTIIEQDHRHIKRKTRPILRFKSFRSASVTIAGIELIHQLRKRQNQNHPDRPLHEKFDTLAA